MAITLTNSFEGGTNTASVTTANSGGTSGNAFDFVTTGAPIPTFSSTQAMHGALSLEVATTAAATSYCQWKASIGTITTQLWFRLYLYMTANPANLHKLLNFAPAAGGAFGALYVSTTGHLRMTDSTGTQTIIQTGTIALNAWQRVEGFVVPSATVGQESFSIWKTSPDSSGTADETQTSAASLALGANAGEADWGCQSSVASVGPLWMDDIGLSSTGYLGSAAGAAVITRVPVVSTMQAVKRASLW